MSNIGVTIHIENPDGTITTEGWNLTETNLEHARRGIIALLGPCLRYAIAPRELMQAITPPITQQAIMMYPTGDGT
jgi:hypothetical protein